MKLIEIYDWAEERGLNDQTPDRNGFCAFIAEEVGEEVAAIRNNNIHEKVDAACDIVVFSIGDMFKRGFKVIDVFGDQDVNAILYSSPYEPINKDYVYEMNYLIHNFLEAKTPEEEFESMKGMFLLSGKEVETLGYDFSKCMDEVMKEINSRVGSYSEEHKKWLKDKSPEAQANWYKADFSKCKRD